MVNEIVVKKGGVNCIIYISQIIYESTYTCRVEWGFTARDSNCNGLSFTMCITNLAATNVPENALKRAETEFLSGNTFND